VPAEPCKSCGASIFYAPTTKGKLMPLDVKPDPKGLVWLFGGVARVGDQPAAMGVTEKFTSHFATCPQAGKWRRRR
jgi:hypothetical protein